MRVFCSHSRSHSHSLSLHDRSHTREPRRWWLSCLPQSPLHETRASRKGGEREGKREGRGGMEGVKPLTLAEATRVSTAWSMFPDRNIRDKKSSINVTTRVPVWSVLAHDSRYLTPQTVIAGGVAFLVTGTAVLSLMLLIGWAEFSSANNIRAFALTTFGLVGFCVMISLVVDLIVYLTESSHRRLTHRHWSIVLIPMALLIILAVFQLTRLLMVAHDIEDLGNAAILRDDDQENEAKFEVIDRLASALWGNIYMWTVVSAPLIASIVARVNGDQVISPRDLYEEVDENIKDVHSASLSALIKATAATETSNFERSVVVAWIMQAVRDLKPTITVYLSKTELASIGAFLDFLLFVVLSAQAFAALLYSVNAVEFDSADDFYIFYFYPAFVTMALIIMALAVELRPTVDGMKTKFTRLYQMEVIAPAVVAALVTSLMAFRGGGIVDAITGGQDDDGDDDGETLFMEESFFFDSSDANSAKTILYNEFCSFISYYPFTTAVFLYYLFTAVAARLRPTIVATRITFDPRLTKGVLSDSALWGWIDTSSDPEMKKRKRLLDPSAASEPDNAWGSPESHARALRNDVRDEVLYPKRTPTKW